MTLSAAGQPGASLGHLLARLGIVESRVRRAVELRRAEDPEPNDPFRGLYLSDEAVDRLLAAGQAPLAPAPVETASQAETAHAEEAGVDLRLPRLARDFGLTPFDVEVLLVAMAPDVDVRFESLYGYLNNDVTRRRASVGLALALCGVPEAAAAARARFTAHGPLVSGGLVVIEDPERPLLSRALRVPDRVVSHLLGDDAPDPSLVDVLGSPPPEVTVDAGSFARVLASGVRLAYLREGSAASGASLGCAAVSAMGRPVLVLDLRRLAARPDAAALAAAAVRDARLAGAVLVGSPVDALAERDPDLVRVFTGSAGTVILAGTMTWDSLWSPGRQPLLAEVSPLGPAQRSTLWRACLDGELAAGVDAAAATAQFVLSPEQVVRAAGAARMRATLRGGPVIEDDLRHGARAQNAVGLERLARRIVPAVSWDDLVLPESTVVRLREVALRARHRTRVLDEWRMRPGGARGRGVTTLFAGDSGTGKTMSAEVIAADLGLDLYAVDLSSVVDKYVGETEKNLERIFSEASGVNAVLLFDEADAIFGKRSEVRDAHDRYANIESAYLLQRMESFDGLAILATNLRANLDEAFTRRLDVVVDFGMPDEPLRRRLWEQCLGPRIPRASELDLDFCARSFQLSGGNIRSAVVTAAYLAAEHERAVTTRDLVAAVHLEYRKLGRLTLPAEFGPYHAELR